MGERCRKGAHTVPEEATIPFDFAAPVGAESSCRTTAQSSRSRDLAREFGQQQQIMIRTNNCRERFQRSLQRSVPSFGLTAESYTMTFIVTTLQPGW